jgi:hypothetical protein
MWRILILSRPRSEVLTLQKHAERAGYAWTCPYSSSAEFEAAVIRSRRRAGAYRSIQIRRYAVYAAILVAAAAAATATTYLVT